MIDPMINFSLALINGVAVFFGTEPGLQLFTVILLCFICKAVKIFTH